MTNDAQYKYDIFLSHNHADEEWTRKLAERLEKEAWQGRKLIVFFSPWDIRPGQSIPLEIERALPKSRKVGLIMSPEAMASAWVELERLVTTYIGVSARQERLIPLYRRTCEIPALLQPVLYLDFRDDAKFEESYRKLLAVIKDEPLPRGSSPSSAAPELLPPAIPRPPAVGFVQRHDEHKRNILEQVKAELAPEKNQLVVLWGRGGAGKTTLAAEAVREMSETFPDRIVWISALSHADLTLATLLNEIAAQLGRPDLRPLPPEEKEEQVRALIAAAPTLIVLDNFETIRPEEQKACVRFLAERAPCPALITTRSEINEDEVNNIPLDQMRLEEARELLKLLIEHTRKPERFKALNQDEIIRKTEFNPLLLKWVVRQIDLAKKPETALSYLAKGDTKVAERIFDRSFNLESVSDDGRDVLLALSLFVPDASREALAAVAGFGDDLLRLDKAVENLASVWLIDATEEGERLIIQGLIYERAKARLSKDVRADEFRQRFVAYFLSYAQARAKPTPEDLDALEAEEDNLLASIEMSFNLENWDSVIQLAYAIAFPGLLDIRGYWDEAIRIGKQAMKAARNLLNEEHIASFAHNIAVTRQFQGELEEARRLYDESLEIKKKLGDQSGIASTLHQLGWLAQAQGELEEARRLYDESLEIAKKLGDQSSIATTLHNLAVIAQGQGELEEARRLYDESLEIKKKLGNQSGIAVTLHQLGRLAQDQGELEEARRLYNESLEIKKKLGDQSGIASTLGQLGLLAELEGNRDEAVRLIREALGIFEKLKSPYAEIARRVLKRLETEAS